MILERSQQIAVRIFGDVMQRGNGEDQRAVRLLGLLDMSSILEDNRCGLQPRGTILDGHLDPTVQPET